MSIRWRLAILAIQLLLLAAGTLQVTGSIVSGDLWFTAGLLAVVVNPNLLEPWYAKPQDVLVNALIAGVLFLLATKTVTAPGWIGLAIFLILVGGAALIALVLGAGRGDGGGVALGRSAMTISRVGTAALIYSIVFWLSLLESFPGFTMAFWTLAGAWAAVMLLGAVNWQLIWSTITRKPIPCTPEAIVGPSVLRLSGTVLPPPGTLVSIARSGSHVAQGLMITRIQRAADAWGEVFIAEGSPESLVRAPSLTVTAIPDSTHNILGAVDAGSTDRSLKFTTPTPLATGQVVAVAEGDADVLYQIVFAEVDRSDVRGGSHLIVRARAAQLGRFNPSTGRIDRHLWVPSPGRAVTKPKPVKELASMPESWLRIGAVLGTTIPVFIDLEAVVQGHLTILGMTRMGNTSFAVQLATALANRHSVLVLDQTGEYVQKRGLKIFHEGDEDREVVSVFEPKTGELPAKRALECLFWLVEKAAAEYRTGEPPKRVLVLEEAHQFVPEPAGLGFNAPGRDESYKFGLLMMQIRKYGLSVVLISQRTAVVAKSALSQCENIIAFKSVDQTGLDYLESLMGDEARSVLPTLQQGQALAFGPAMSLDAPVVIDVIPPDSTSMRNVDPAGQQPVL